MLVFADPYALVTDGWQHMIFFGVTRGFYGNIFEGSLRNDSLLPSDEPRSSSSAGRGRHDLAVAKAAPATLTSTSKLIELARLSIPKTFAFKLEGGSKRDGGRPGARRRRRWPRDLAAVRRSRGGGARRGSATSGWMLGHGVGCGPAAMAGGWRKSPHMTEGTIS
jgi:hypothetical protein